MHTHPGGGTNVAQLTGGRQTANFIGCIGDLQVNGRVVDLVQWKVDGWNVRPCPYDEDHRVQLRYYYSYRAV